MLGGFVKRQKYHSIDKVILCEHRVRVIMEIMILLGRVSRVTKTKKTVLLHTELIDKTMM